MNDFDKTILILNLNFTNSHSNSPSLEVILNLNESYTKNMKYKIITDKKKIVLLNYEEFSDLENYLMDLNN